MGYILFALFVGVPLLEIAVFVAVGGEIGLWPTLGAVVATALAGSVLLRVQGLSTLYRAREHLERGELPVKELFDGVCLVFAGALLLTPGFVTDGVGLLLFLPPFRAAIRRGLGSLFIARGTIRTFHAQGPDGGPDDGSHGPGGPAASGGKTIDGDFTVIDEDEDGGDPPTRRTAVHPALSNER
ncbi:MAG: FxsA family protein [Rhodospirillales bacterium]|nr:FxsA family protein [Rhodospirillales bacterium]